MQKKQNLFFCETAFAIQLYDHFYLAYGSATSISLLDRFPKKYLKYISPNRASKRKYMPQAYIHNPIPRSFSIIPKNSIIEARYIVRIHTCGDYLNENDATYWINIYSYDGGRLFKQIPILYTLCSRTISIHDQEIIFHLSMLNRNTRDNFVSKLLHIVFILRDCLPLELRLIVCKYIPFFDKIYHHYQF